MEYCKVPDCDNQIKVKKWQLCSTHYNRHIEGKPLVARNRQSPNEIRIKGDVAEMDVYAKDNSVAYTTIFDASRVNQVREINRWGYVSRDNRRWGPYVVRHGKGGETKIVYLHRHLMRPIPKGMWVDHISGDTLDNRASNLRICKPEENVWNQRQQVGILLVKGRYRAQISREFDAYEEALEQRLAWEDGRI